MYTIFLSYPRQADDHGDVSVFRDRLQSEVRATTGRRDLRIFLDQQEITSGDRWEHEIRQALVDAALLVPLVQPLFFSSEWCERELTIFDRVSRRRERTDRIVPVLWRTSRQLDEAGETAKLLRSIQYFDWRHVRLELWDDPKKRRELQRLASQIGDRLFPTTNDSVGGGPRVEPVPPPTDPAALRALTQLFLSMFSHSELIRFLDYQPFGRALTQGLPARSSLAELAHAAVLALDRNRHLDERFFRALKDERPFRHTEISGVQALFR